MLKNENNKQTVEASKRRSLDEFFFSYRFEPHSVRSYCWQWRIEHRASGMYQLREVKQPRGRRQQERQKSNRFRLTKQQLCTCITLFCTLLSRRCTTTMNYDVIMPNYPFCRGRKHQKTTFFFFSWTLILSFRIQLQKLALANSWRIKGDGISAIKFEAARTHFLSDVFVVVAVVVA